MIKSASDHPVSWWSEVLPITILSALLVYLMLTWSPFLGIVMLLPVVLFAYLFGTETLWWCVVGLVPLSLNTELFLDSPVNMYVPTEPLLLGFLMLSLFFFIRKPVERRFLNHPISRLVIVYFGWIFVTVLFSSHPMVSLKSFVAQMWFVVPVLYLGSTIMKWSGNRFRFLNVYLAGFAIIVSFTIIRLWSYGFPEKESQWLMQPFFKDHTILGAVLGLVLPYVYLRCFERSVGWAGRSKWVVLGLICTVVLIFTYSRAAILSLGVAGMLYLFILMQIKFKYLVGAGILLLSLLWWNQDSLINRLSSNEAQSSGEVMENIESISNVTTDASNLERINRWNSAIAMWKERPVVGWGPGTYQFVYAPFQKSADLTIISTNIGDVGNAHSEFLGTLAESGGLALVFLMMLVVTVIGTAYRRVLELEGRDRMLLLAVLLGIVAYFTHGLLNNFLNSDKVSVLIWGFIAIIIHYDIEGKHQAADGR